MRTLVAAPLVVLVVLVLTLKILHAERLSHYVRSQPPEAYCLSEHSDDLAVQFACLRSASMELKSSLLAEIRRLTEVSRTNPNGGAGDTRMSTRQQVILRYNELEKSFLQTCVQQLGIGSDTEHALQQLACITGLQYKSLQSMSR